MPDLLQTPPLSTSTARPPSHLSSTEMTSVATLADLRVANRRRGRRSARRTWPTDARRSTRPSPAFATDCRQSRTHLVLEQVDLRRRATAKFTHADRMFFTRIGLEQATDEWVAAYKASRFTTQRAGSSSTPGVFADLCCGIGGDLFALAQNATAIGIDRDPICRPLRRCEHRRDHPHNQTSPTSTSQAPQASTPGTSTPTAAPPVAARHRSNTCQPNLATIDALLSRLPKRRHQARPRDEVTRRMDRTLRARMDQPRPRMPTTRRLARQPRPHPRPAAAQPSSVPLPPARGVPSAELNSPHPHRPPLPTNYHRPTRSTASSSTSTPPSSPLALPAHSPPNTISARLPPAQPTSPARRQSPTTTHSPASKSKTSCRSASARSPRLLRERHIGQLEIKKRGVDIDPEKLRRDLKLRGNNAATLLITQIAGRPTAILAQRVSP